MGDYDGRLEQARNANASGQARRSGTREWRAMRAELGTGQDDESDQVIPVDSEFLFSVSAE